MCHHYFLKCEGSFYEDSLSNCILSCMQALRYSTQALPGFASCRSFLSPVGMVLGEGSPHQACSYI